MDSIEVVLEANFSEAEPKEIHALLYSDGTIGGLRAIEQFKHNEIHDGCSSARGQQLSQREEITKMLKSFKRYLC